jgi:hypothetical protein
MESVKGLHINRNSKTMFYIFCNRSSELLIHPKL